MGWGSGQQPYEHTMLGTIDGFACVIVHTNERARLEVGIEFMMFCAFLGWPKHAFSKFHELSLRFAATQSLRISFVIGPDLKAIDDDSSVDQPAGG